MQRRLGTNAETGLSGQAARDAKLQYGPNRLKGEGAVQWYVVLGKQISNAMILVSFAFYLMRGGEEGEGKSGFDVYGGLCWSGVGNMGVRTIV